MKTAFWIFHFIYLFLVAFTLHYQNDEIFKLRAELVDSHQKNSVTLAKCSVEAGKYDRLLSEANGTLFICNEIIKANEDNGSTE